MSEVRANNIANAAGTGPATLHKQSAAKAWANINGTGTISIPGSFNIASTTDNGVGDYTFNFTNAMISSFFGSNITPSDTMDPIIRTAGRAVATASSLQIVTKAGTSGDDFAANSISIYGDLA